MPAASTGGFQKSLPAPIHFDQELGGVASLELLAFVLLLLQPSSETMEKLVLATASPGVDSVVKKLGALRSVYADLENLKQMLTTVQTGLDDAESRSITDLNLRLRRWLRKLGDAALDAEDVVEEFETEALRRRMEGCDRMAGKVRHDFFSSNNSILFRCKMASKIKEIAKRLDAIDQESKRFRLLSKPSSQVLMERETSSLVVESEIYGRDEDEKEVMKFLIDGDNEKNISVLPIFGLGGVGKTTLAQIVYNKDRIKKQFDQLRMWVCVGEKFDVKVVSQKMIEEVKGGPSDRALNLNTSLSFLQEKMRTTKFLLVIDDLWTEKESEWDSLKPLFNQAKLGSKIIITTRFENVAHMTGTVSPYRLKELQSDDCWTIFRKRAFRFQKEEDNQELVVIGKEIIKKCGGLPLAAEALGNLMRSKRGKVQWQAIRDDDIWKLPIDDIGIFPILKLSYDHLPSPLKRCFTYCSMFPKDHSFQINELIQLWMAEGLIDAPDTSLHAEDIGKQYFNNLWQRSFFQDVKMDANNNFNRCKMHDLVHDLACLLAKDESWFLEKGKENIPSGCRYLSIEVLDLPSNSLKTICEAKKLRSLVLLHCGYLDMPEFMFNVTKNLTQLHSLDLNGYSIKKLSDGISNLKHLRLLNLSSSSITTLPTPITRLYNLQTLDLSYCEELQELPEGIYTLHNLQTLNLCYCAKLQELPKGISTLYNLKTLDLSYCEELQKLPEGIYTLHNLQALNLCCCAKLQELPEGITTLPNLQTLDLSFCKELQKLPEGISTLYNLQTLNFSYCAKLQELPKGISTLYNLQTLNLSYCEELQKLPEGIYTLHNLHILNLNHCAKLQVLPEGISTLSNLQTLNLSYCEELQELPKGIYTLHNLQTLNLSSCAKLQELPEVKSTLHNLQTLNLSYCAELQELPEGISTLYNLQTLNLGYCYKLQELPQDISSLINLRHLDISGCENMSSIPQRLGQLTKLQTLGMFIVAKEYGRTIMELQHLNSIQGSLIIRSLQHVKDSNEAIEANLKIKRLDRLELQWETGLYEKQESSTNVVEEVLERLRPHDNLKELIINNYMGSRLPTWMSSSLLKLVELHLRGLKRCGCLLPLGQLPLLKKLSMVGMRAIRRIGEEFYGDGNGDIAFRSLEVLYLKNMLNLEEWNTKPTGRNMTTFLHLTELSITSCPKLMVQPCIPCSVEELVIQDSYKMHVSEGSLAGLFKLKKLDLSGVSSSSLSEWLDGLQCSISLEELQIRSCSLNWEGRKQQQPTPFFTALRSLTIGGADELPEWIGGITSLRTLDISGCPKLAMLPDGLRQLTALQIFVCPQLAKRCKRETGEDWHHIRVHQFMLEEDGSEEEDRREAEDGEESSKIRTLVANFFGLFGLACCIGHN